MSSSAQEAAFGLLFDNNNNNNNNNINGFLASTAGTRTLQAQILRNSLAADEDMSAPLNHWQSLSGLPAGDVFPVGSQRVLNYVVVGHIFESLVNNQTTQYHRARLLAAAAANSDDWFHAMSISACGLRTYVNYS